MGTFVERAARLVKTNVTKNAFATQMHTDDLGCPAREAAA